MGGHTKRAARVEADRIRRNAPPNFPILVEDDDDRDDRRYIGDYEEDSDEDLSVRLYPEGKIANMTNVELIGELMGQCDIQGSLGDKEECDDTAVERTELRIDLIKAEMRRRGME